MQWMMRLLLQEHWGATVFKRLWLATLHQCWTACDYSCLQTATVGSNCLTTVVEYQRVRFHSSFANCPKNVAAQSCILQHSTAVVVCSCCIGSCALINKAADAQQRQQRVRMQPPHLQVKNM
jgi:hypothetical protein